MSQVIPLGPGARMLTTREVAQRLGVSLRTVQLWVEAGILPAAKTPGGHRRIPYNAVEALALSTGLGGDPLGGTKPGKRELLALRQMGADAVVAPMPVASRHAPMDILLVADELDWQQRCEAALAPYGSAVKLRFAESGYLALLQIGQQTPDLLITDLELPGMDGMAMLHTLERSASLAQMRILLLTSLSEDELARRGGVPDSVEVMHRPVSPEAVAVRVASCLLVGQQQLRSAARS
ncbi:MAG TPA: excisionase family DNA-binding protein [Aquabacterium sp.]|nr:excisionase family DNA-binding protein [Aquabacterium sp.]